MVLYSQSRVHLLYIGFVLAHGTAKACPATRVAMSWSLTSGPRSGGIFKGMVSASCFVIRLYVSFVRNGSMANEIKFLLFAICVP